MLVVFTQFIPRLRSGKVISFCRGFETLGKVIGIKPNVESLLLNRDQLCLCYRTTSSAFLIHCYFRTDKGHSLQSYRGELSPMEQWHRQCCVTSFFAQDEVELRHTLGVGNMMWGSDLPHVEDRYPKSRQHLAELFAGVPREEVEAIVGMNAARAMNFDVATLAKTPAAKLS